MLCFERREEVAMLKRLVLVLALLMPTVLVAEETLSEAADKEKARRAKQKGQPAKVYTNEDLPSEEETKVGKKDGTKGKGKATPTVTPTPAPSAGADRRVEEAQWKGRAAAARSALQQAEVAVAALKDALSRLGTQTIASTDTSEILRLKEEQEKVRAEIEQAEQTVQAAKGALAELEEEARRQHIPPGWLR
jgi:hypothetical protein